MRRIALVTTLALVVLAALAWVNRDALTFLAFRAMLAPGESFAATIPPPAPDYADLEAWASLPDRADAVDVAPPGYEDAQARALVDVFFVHPTTYITADGWNQPLDHDDANTATDQYVLRHQASVQRKR